MCPLINAMKAATCSSLSSTLSPSSSAFFPLSEMKMEKNINILVFFFFLAITILFIDVSAGDWNILNQKINKNVESSNDDLKKYCESWRINVELNNIRGYDVVPRECTDYIGKYMKSTQYKLDSRKAMEEASLHLSNCCHFHGDGKDAWIFDIDDTLLSTMPYFKKHNYGGEKLNLTSFEGWMREKKGTVLDHTMRLFNEIRGRDIKIFLISSRRECLRDATVDNLLKVGYHGWHGLVLRGLEDEYKQVSSYKAEARKKLADERYRIWGIVGDQWSSFGGYPTGKRTFKLPNSLYYVF